MRRVLILVALLLAGCVTTERKPFVATEQQIRPLAEFVAEQTGYKMNRLPKVVFDREAMMQRLREGGVESSPWHALYHRKTRTVYVDHVRYDLSNVHGEAMTVHELVHHGQLLSKKTFACQGEREAEAYAVQNAYLAKHGIRPLTAAEIGHLTTC
jgi:uncharacterized lipoprotein YmbA